MLPSTAVSPELLPSLGCQAQNKCAFPSQFVQMSYPAQPSILIFSKGLSLSFSRAQVFHLE